MMPPYSCAVPGSRGRVTGCPQNPQEVGLCSQLGGLPPPQRATPHTAAPSRHPEYGDVTNPEGILQDLQIKWVPHWAKPPLLAPTSVNDSPGRKPGTSTNVMSGILNASQNRTKRAPFTDELMSKHPRKRQIIQAELLGNSQSHPHWECTPSNHAELVTKEAPKLPPQKTAKGILTLQEKLGRQENPPGTGQRAKEWRRP